MMRRHLDRLAWPLALLGLAAVAGHNWRLWRRDWAFLAARAAPDPLPPPGEWPERPLVSVLVAAWNEAAHIDRHVESFLALRYPHRELILCAGGEDGTFERAGRYAGPAVKVLRQRPGEGKQRALAKALAASRGAILFLTDADCELSEEAFTRVLYPLIQGQAQVVSGCAKPLDAQLGEPLVRYQWLNDALWSFYLPRTLDGILGRNSAMRREVLESIGGFSHPVATGTDYQMSRRLARAGYAIVSAPQSFMATEYPATARDYVGMWRRWNKNLLIHGVRFGAWRDVGHVLISFGLYAALVLTPLLTPLFGGVALAISGLLAGAALMNRARRIVAGSYLTGASTAHGLFKRLPFYTLLDMSAVGLAVLDSVRPRMRDKW